MPALFLSGYLHAYFPCYPSLNSLFLVQIPPLLDSEFSAFGGGTALFCQPSTCIQSPLWVSMVLWGTTPCPPSMHVVLRATCSFLGSRVKCKTQARQVFISAGCQRAPGTGKYPESVLRHATLGFNWHYWRRAIPFPLGWGDVSPTWARGHHVETVRGPSQEKRPDRQRKCRSQRQRERERGSQTCRAPFSLFCLSKRAGPDAPEQPTSRINQVFLSCA